MWVLKKQFKFEASHLLKYHDGKCHRLHGHSWVGEIEVECIELQSSGPKKNMAIDYYDLGLMVKEIEDTLDHQHLNSILDSDMPTSEFLSWHIYEMLKPKFPREGVYLKAVTIHETCTTSCRYSE